MFCVRSLTTDRGAELQRTDKEKMVWKCGKGKISEKDTGKSKFYARKK